MEYRQLEDVYKLKGLYELKLNVLEDILHVYDLDVLEVEGYEFLSENNKELYKKFILNFFNSWGLEARRTIKPISFNEIEAIEYMGKEYPEDEDLISLKNELYIIKNDGSKELYRVKENKENKIKVVDTFKKKYNRFEYEILGKQGWIHVLNENEWY